MSQGLRFLREACIIYRQRAKPPLSLTSRFTLSNTFLSTQPSCVRWFTVSACRYRIRNGGPTVLVDNLIKVKNNPGFSDLYQVEYNHGICTRSRRHCSSSSKQPSNKEFFNISWYSVLVTLLFGAGSYYFYIHLERGYQLKESQARLDALAEAGLGKLNWSLTDQHGKIRTYSEFRGKWLMIYFGFCHCPDICPEELEKLVDVVKGIDNDTSTPEIQPIFITLDPERDTVPFLRKYCKDFSDKLIGFTGTTQEIADVAKSYRVYYSLGEKDSDGDYIVDHTICMYLINPEGQLTDVYQRRANVKGIIKGTISHMHDYVEIMSKVTPSPE